MIQLSEMTDMGIRALMAFFGTIAFAVLSIAEPNDSTTYADIARSLAADYYNIYLIDADTNDYIEYSSQVGGEDISLERRGVDFFESVRRDTMTRIYEEDREPFLALFTKENVLRDIDAQGVFTTTYRLIDLSLFALLLLLFENLIVRAARVWYADQLYTVSVVGALTCIVLMRWGPWAGIHAVLGGAVFCMGCDLIARTMFAPTELSISTVTAVFGAPVVIRILLQRREK